MRSVRAVTQAMLQRLYGSRTVGVVAAIRSVHAVTKTMLRRRICQAQWVSLLYPRQWCKEGTREQRAQRPFLLGCLYSRQAQWALVPYPRQWCKDDTREQRAQRPFLLGGLLSKTKSTPTSKNRQSAMLEHLQIPNAPLK
ncbi:hypothetical protein NDU88_005412 [Pleurodeles waltl]|uniref:Secreted protein n=1 Tax=Pleurodeles waltl TaxID=8319 RepID=A0AAV7LL27_PLEWA|nr:hypothetical protein NDU88_005412 [Pleurodeles waltl]